MGRAAWGSSGRPGRGGDGVRVGGAAVTSASWTGRAVVTATMTMAALHVTR